jgi:hypothetical protein
VPEIERLTATNHGIFPAELEQIFSSRCHAEQAKDRSLPQTFAASDFATPSGDTMVEPDGIEPTTSCLQSRRSPS